MAAYNCGSTLCALRIDPMSGWENIVDSIVDHNDIIKPEVE